MLTFYEDTKINLREKEEIKIFYAWFCIIFEKILIKVFLSSKMMNEHNLKRVFSSSTTWLIHKRFIRAEFFNIQHNNSTFQVINQILMEIPWHRSSSLNSNWVRMKKIDEKTVKLKKWKVTGQNECEKFHAPSSKISLFWHMPYWIIDLLSVASFRGIW